MPANNSSGPLCLCAFITPQSAETDGRWKYLGRTRVRMTESPQHPMRTCICMPQMLRWGAPRYTRNEPNSCANASYFRPTAPSFANALFGTALARQARGAKVVEVTGVSGRRYPPRACQAARPRRRPASSTRILATATFMLCRSCPAEKSTPAAYQARKCRSPV